MQITRLPPRPHCAACHAPLQIGEHLYCGPCRAGGDFLTAALAYAEMIASRKARRWPR